MRKTVASNVSLVATDDVRGYRGLNQSYPHGVVNQGAHEYVRGNIHTSNIDSFWSLLKRGIIGIFHNVSKDYLPLYLAEGSFRHNNRGNTDIFTELVAGC